MRWLGIDIGGAHLKLADGEGYAESVYFPLWERPKQLEQELRTLVAGAPLCDHIVCCMSGELADCFQTRSDGVQYIVQTFVKAVDHRHARVYRLDGKIVTPQVIRENPLLAAASNWHALARFAGRYAKTGPAILIDVGSTTVDIVPLIDGAPVAKAFTDTDRLFSGELVYTGVIRSPICSIAESIPYSGRECPLAGEVFSTMRDAYLVLGDLPEDAMDRNTADRRPATREWALGRLARSICTDRMSFTPTDAMNAAQFLAGAQLKRVSRSFHQVAANLGQAPRTVIVSGQGEFLARRVVDQMRLHCNIVSLNEQLGPMISRCAPAHAVAVLASEI